jgi:hypothetical protein
MEDQMEDFVFMNKVACCKDIRPPVKNHFDVAQFIDSTNTMAVLANCTNNAGGEQFFILQDLLYKYPQIRMIVNQAADWNSQ